MKEQRLINKDTLIPFIKANGFVYANTLETFPEVDPVRHGHWIEHKSAFEQYEPTTYECSLCHAISLHRSNYCPTCGARMDGEKT